VSAGPEAGEWLQQATLGIRAHVPVEVLSDTIQPFPSFSGIYDTALKALSMAIADMPPPAGPMDADGGPGIMTTPVSTPREPELAGPAVVVSRWSSA